MEVAPLAHKTEQALQRFPIGRTTLYALAKAGRIVPFHVGRATFWSDAELVRLVDELQAEAEAIAEPAEAS